MSLSEFIRHPRTFMRNNAVWVSGELNAMGRATSGLYPVTIAPARGVSCTKNGAAMPCFEVKPATDLGMTLAYFLPWEPNSTKVMTLGTKADLFLTDSMNGCSFAAATGMSPTVAHVNYNMHRTEGQPIDQAEIDNEIAATFPHGGPAKTLKKADYVTSTFPNVTVMGVRKTTGWEFYYQKRNYTGATATRNYEYKSVHKIR